MKKALLLLMLIAAIGYYGIGKQGKNPGKLIYGEARVAMKVLGREIEAVAIGQRYEEHDCLDASGTNEFLESCLNDGLCIQTSFECKAEISAQYTHMLERSEATTHYVHLRHKTDELKGVVLMWGLTRAESNEACTAIANNLN